MPRSDPRDLVSRAYETLREQIVNGRLAPGSRIIESDLAERLGVSRTPVRGALQRLQQEGYVQPLDGGRNLRLIVAPLTRTDCVEVLNLLGAAEGLATRWAARLPEHARLELASDLERLNGDLAELLATPAPDPQRIFRCHFGFHLEALARVRSPRLDALHAAVVPQTERYRRVYITTAPTGFEGEVEEHRGIVEAIRAGDAEAAQLAVQHNWERAAERLGRTVERLGERGTW
jgi:DNA-binding GntR family transcriptional regulator